MQYVTERYIENVLPRFTERLYKSGVYPYLYLCRDDVRNPIVVELRDIALWCQEQFGEGSDNFGHHMRWAYSTAGMIGFQREADAFAFKLRWC